MTRDATSDSHEFSIEHALARFDLLIDRLSQPDQAVEKAPETEPASRPDEQLEVAPGEAVETPGGGPETVDDIAVDETPIRSEGAGTGPVILTIDGLTKSFGGTVAVDEMNLTVRSGQIYGIVGPNGAGKTTTLSMVTGVLRPDEGTVVVNGADVWGDPVAAKRVMGILPDRLMLFDRLSGRQLLFYAGVLRGLDRATVVSRSADLISAFGIGDAQDRLVTDYSAGMTRKIALAAAMIHSPRLLILDEPFESVDAVSVDLVRSILRKYADAGGTVVLSSHSMDLVENFCDSVAVVSAGRVLTSGTTEQVRGDAETLEERFIELIGGVRPGEDMEWLRSFSD